MEGFPLPSAGSVKKNQITVGKNLEAFPGAHKFRDNDPLRGSYLGKYAPFFVGININRYITRGKGDEEEKDKRKGTRWNFERRKSTVITLGK
jgi:hypothetical protein